MAKEFKDWVDEFVENGANPKDVSDWPNEASGVLTLDITSEDITIEDGKIVFNSDVAQEIMSMNKRIRVDASITDPTLEQGKFIAVFTPRGIIDYSSLQPNTIVYEYSTTNWLLDTYRTTYVEFVWNKTTEKLYVDKNAPTHYEDHIVGFNTSFNDGNIRLTENVDMQVSSLNVLHINDYNIISTNTPSPSLEFNANSNNELESVVFREDGSSVDFTYTIPKGAKHYVVNELPTTDIDTTGNYYVMTESEDGRKFLPTDITNLSQSEYPSTNLNTLRQNPVVNGSDFTRLQVSQAGMDKYRGDFAIKFNIPCTVLITLKPSQPYGSYMYLDVNGVNDLLITAGHTYDYARNFNVGETLYVRGECTSAHILSYKLAIQPHIIDGKIPLSTNVDEYINFENIWFKNGDGTKVVANPTLAGTEADLTGLEVDGIKYKVESYKNYYVVTSDDITDFTPLGSSEFEITLSEELENVITDFKQGIYIDWVTLFPDIPSSYNVCCYVPTKKVVLDGKIHYLLSCVDSFIDATLSFYKVDNQWKLSMIEATLVDRETLNYEVSQLNNAINGKLDLKADKSDTYTKQEINEVAISLTSDIDAVRANVVTIDNRTTVLETDVSTLQNNTYSKTEVDEKIDDISAYTKSEIDTMINAKADKTTVEGINTRVGTLETDIADLESVQNVVNVVATKSALNSYDTSKLEANDKVQVIADETHDSASTIYNWNGSAWVYVGAFGGNSYTKAETYNKTQIDSALSDKADKSDTYTKTEIDNTMQEVGQIFEVVANEIEKKINAEYVGKGTNITQTSYSNTNPNKSGKVKLYKLGGMSYKVNGTIQHSAVYAIHSMNGSNIYNHLSIPNEIQNLTGYGWGINDTCYNYIDFERKVFVQKVGRVLGLTYESNIIVATTLSGLTCVAIQTDIDLIANNQDTIVQLNNLGLTAVSASYQWATTETNVIACNDQKKIIINFDQSLTDEEMIEKAKTLILYFKFITPIETDISSYITKDTLDVVEGGTLEFLNTYNQAVPNEVAYLFNAVTLNNIVDSNGNTNVIATKQELNEKSKVVANPTLAGTEADLTGLEVDGAKFKVPKYTPKYTYEYSVNISVDYKINGYTRTLYLNVRFKSNNSYNLGHFYDKQSVLDDIYDYFNTNGNGIRVPETYFKICSGGLEGGNGDGDEMYVYGNNNMQLIMNNNVKQLQINIHDIYQDYTSKTNPDHLSLDITTSNLNDINFKEAL